MSNQGQSENPKYGWYVGKIILVIGIVGGNGLAFLILGFYVGTLLRIVFWIIGITLCLIFLWPTIGMIALNLWIPRFNPTYGFLIEFKAPKVLDCGCGTGRHAIMMAKQLPEGGFLTGIDIYDSIAISGSSLKRVQKNAELEGVADITKFQMGSITEIPFENQSFDIVSVGSVMHEIHNDADKIKAYKEIHRVLKNDGLLYFSEWNRNSLNLILWAGIFVFVFKSKTYWENQLKKYRFKVIKTDNFMGFINFFAKKA